MASKGGLKNVAKVHRKEREKQNLLRKGSPVCPERWS